MAADDRQGAPKQGIRPAGGRTCAPVYQKQTPLSIDDVTAMVAGQIGQLAPMDEETADLFKQLAKKMMKGIE